LAQDDWRVLGSVSWCCFCELSSPLILTRLLGPSQMPRMRMKPSVYPFE